MSSPSALAGQKPATARASNQRSSDDSRQHRLRVVEQRARRGAEFVVVENRRILSGQLPGREERRPVDIGHELGEPDVGERRGAERARLGRQIAAAPVEFQRVAARGGERDAALLLFAARMAVGDAGIFGAQVGDIAVALLARQERRGDADRAARVVDIDRLAAPVVRVDLHRGMHAARGGAADQQRHGEALPLHLGGDMAHLVERRRDQAREPDDVGAFGFRDLEDLRGRHHDAEVDHLVIVALEHDADDVLADVVDVALDGGEHDPTGAAPAPPTRPSPAP